MHDVPLYAYCLVAKHSVINKELVCQALYLNRIHITFYLFVELKVFSQLNISLIQNPTYIVNYFDCSSSIKIFIDFTSLIKLIASKHVHTIKIAIVISTNTTPGKLLYHLQRKPLINTSKMI